MRILMVAARYLPFLGGVETHVHEVGLRMTDMGHEVVILTTDATGALPADEFFRGMTIKRVRAYPKNRDYYFAPRIYSEIAHSNCDIVHFQGYNTFVPMIGIPAAIRKGTPFVLTFHSGGHPSKFRNSIRGIQQKVLAPLVSRADQLIGVSEFEANLFSGSMGIDRSRFVVARNGASLPTPSKPPVTNPNLILSIGRLERYKGHHRAIEAMPHLIARRPDARLMIVGTGPYEPDLRELTHSLRMDSRVSFISIPPSDRQHFADLLYSAGLVVLLSEYEANPLAVMEALGAQRKVIVSYTSGLCELADEGWCRAISIDASPTTTAQLMQAELESDQQIAAFAVPTWEDCARQLLGVYEAVLKDRALCVGSDERHCLDLHPNP